MKSKTKSTLAAIIDQYESEILKDWISLQIKSSTFKSNLISETDLRKESKDLLNAIKQALQNGNIGDIKSNNWDNVRDLLSYVSGTRAKKGFSPSETASFIFSLKEPLFNFLKKEISKDPESFADEVWLTTTLIDDLGLYTTEVFIKSREEIIRLQQDELLELSTPVVKLWDGVLALPLIGTLDSNRTQMVMENLLNRIVETNSTIAIIDITGVPAVDTLVAQHLIKTISATRLMGAECIISGVRPQIAQTMVHLGLTLTDVVTKSTLADAFTLALKKLGHTINKPQQRLD